MQEYTGEVIPLKEYEGEVLPLEQEVMSNQPAPPVENSDIPGTPAYMEWEQQVAAEQQAKKEALDGETQKAVQDLQNSTPLDTLSSVGTVAAAVPKGIINGVNNMVETGLAVGDMAAGAGREVLSGIGILPPREPGQQPGTNMAETFDKAVPTLDYGEGIIPQTIGKTAEVGVGAVLGDKGFSKMTGTLGPAKSALGNAVRGAGRNIASDIGGAISQDEEDSALFMQNEANMPALRGFANDENGSYSQNLLAHRLDLATTAIILGRVTGSAAKGLEKAGTYGINLIPKAFSNWHSMDAHQKQFVTDILSIYKGVTPDMPKAEVQKRIAEGAAYVQKNSKIALTFGDDSVKDIEHQMDTITFLINSLDQNDPAQRAIATELDGLRASALSGGSSQLKTGLESGSRELKNTLDQFHDTRGGKTSMEGAKDVLVDSGQKELQPIRDKIATTRAEQVQAQKGIDAEIAENPAFNDIVKKNPDEGVKIDYTTGETDKATEITQRLGRAEEVDTAYKNKLYDQIPDDAKVNTTSFADALEKANPVLDDTIRATIPSSGNFKELNKWADTYLEPAYQQARKDGLWDKANGLKELKKNIKEDQLDYLTTSGQGAAKDAAIKARDNFKDDYAPKYRDNPPMEQIQKNNRFEGDTTALVENRKIVEKVLSDPKEREYTNRVLDILESESGGKNGKLASDYVLYKISSKTREALNSKGKLGADDVAKLTSEFDAYIPVLRKVAPEKIKEIETFLTSVRDKNFNLKEINAKLDEFQALGEAAEQKVYGEQLSEFMKKNSTGWTATSNGETAFKKILNGEDSENKIADLLARGGDDPIVEKGMQAVWAKMANEKLFSNEASIGKLDDTFVSYGKKLFNKNPEAVDAVLQLRDIARAGSRADKTRMTGGLETTASQAKMQHAVTTITTWMFGVLNPTSARIKTISSDYLKKNNSYSRAKQAADNILANPDLFSKIAKEVAADGKGGLSDANKDLIKRVIFKGIVGNYQDSDTLDEETNKAFDIDTSRPIIENDDGSFSTERTATRQDENGKWVVFPTIVNGKELSEDEAWDMLQTGENKSVGTFDTLQESEDYAIKRSEEIGRIREKDRK